MSSRQLERERELTRGKYISEQHQGPSVELKDQWRPNVPSDSALGFHRNDWGHPLPTTPSQTWIFAVDHQTLNQRDKGIVESWARALKCQSHGQLEKQILHGAECLCRVTVCYEDFGKPYRWLLSVKRPFCPSESGFASILCRKLGQPRLVPRDLDWATRTAASKSTGQGRAPSPQISRTQSRKELKVFWPRPTFQKCETEDNYEHSKYEYQHLPFFLSNIHPHNLGTRRHEWHETPPPTVCI